MTQFAPPPTNCANDDTILLTPEQLAAQLQIEIKTLRAMVKAGRIPCYVVGTRYRFNRADVLAALSQPRRDPSDHPETPVHPQAIISRRGRLGPRPVRP